MTAFWSGSHQVLARALCKQRSCSNASRDTAPLPPLLLGRHGGLAVNERGHFQKLAGSRKSLSRHTFRSTSLAREALLSMSTAPPGSPPAWLRAPGLWWCKHREGRCGSRGRRRWPASNPGSKQRALQRLIPARRTSRRATASAHPEGAFRRLGQGRRQARPVQQPCRRLWLPREVPRTSTCRKTPHRRRSIRVHNPSPPRRASIWRPPPCSADRRRASTKREVLIGMLERQEGASVVEIGQRLGCPIPCALPLLACATPVAR